MDGEAHDFYAGDWGLHPITVDFGNIYHALDVSVNLKVF